MRRQKEMSRNGGNRSTHQSYSEQRKESSYRLYADSKPSDNGFHYPHDLRNMGFHVITTIRDAVVFRGHVRHGEPSYSLGSPEWPALGYLPKEPPLTGQMNHGGV